MSPDYWNELAQRVDAVFRNNPEINDHRHDYPWLTGALGNPNSGVWFLGENPSLSQIERVIDPNGGPPTKEAQWWASRGDQLFRSLLYKHGFKSTVPSEHGGWNCYITNVIKEADYVAAWNGSPEERRRTAAAMWAPVISWELKQSRPSLVVALGDKVLKVIKQLKRTGVQFPKVERLDHYSYIALRPRGRQGPMNPERVAEYSDAFARIAKLRAGTSND